MGAVTLKVPAEHAEDFRRALVKEMETDIRSVHHNEDSLAEQLARGAEFADSMSEDVRFSRALLQRNAALMDQVDLSAIGACEVTTDDIETVFAACESMAREVVGPQLADALRCSPLDGSWADEKVRPLIERLTWAIDRAAELDATWQAQNRAKKVA